MQNLYNPQSPNTYLISCVTGGENQEYMSPHSYPKWIEVFGIYISRESGFRKRKDNSIYTIGDPFMTHMILSRGIQTRVQKIFDVTIPEIHGHDRYLHGKRFSNVGEYVFIGKQGWVARASNQFIEDDFLRERYNEHGGSIAYHIGLDGNPIYPHRFKQVGDYEGVGEKISIPYRDISGNNYEYFDGALPIGIQGIGSPIQSHPLAYFVTKYTSYRARAMTLDNHSVWIDENGDIL